MRLRENSRSFSARSTFLAADQLRDQVQLLRADADHPLFGARFIVSDTAGIGSLAHRLLPLGFLVRRVTVIGPRRSKFTELVADHVFGHQHRDEFIAVVHLERSGPRIAA
jgi:hypothetical protein